MARLWIKYGMRITWELIAGVLLTIASVIYWATIGKGTPVDTVPLVYQYTYRLYPYTDIALTMLGMFLFYMGLKNTRKDNSTNDTDFPPVN